MVVVQIFYLPSLVDVLVGIVCYAVGLEICRTIKYTSIIKKKGREAQLYSPVSKKRLNTIEVFITF